ncbi:MAG: hypothetical protein JKY54_15350, partial [Flavobacteriales bacterium]|nr:hypothetical protein [Flavobacteriales bacterium]
PFPYGRSGWKNIPQLKLANVYSNRVDVKLKSRRSKQEMLLTFTEKEQNIGLRDKKKNWAHANVLTSNTWKYAGVNYWSDKKIMDSVFRKVTNANRHAKMRKNMLNKYDKTSANLITDAWLTANSESGDAFILHLQILQDTISFPVLPVINSTDAFHIQKQTADIFLAFDKKRTKSLNSWERIEVSQNKVIKKHEHKLKEFEEEARNPIKRKNRYTISKFRAFTMLSLGTCNVDRLIPVVERIPILAKIANDTTGRKLRYDKLYVLDSRNNTVSKFNKDETPKFTKNGECSLIAVMPNQQLAYCTATTFMAKQFASYGDKIPMTLVEGNVNLTQLRAMLNE